MVWMFYCAWLALTALLSFFSKGNFEHFFLFSLTVAYGFSMVPNGYNSIQQPLLVPFPLRSECIILVYFCSLLTGTFHGPRHIDLKMCVFFSFWSQRMKNRSFFPLINWLYTAKCILKRKWNAQQEKKSSKKATTTTSWS